MELPRWVRGLMGRWVVATGLFGAPGCMPFLHTIDAPPVERVTACKAAPSCCRNHVYVFLVHGLDPFDWANMAGLRDHIQGLGFRKTYYGQMYHTPRFEKEIRRLRQEDPEARFVLIGFSFGANMVRHLANQARAEDIPIDLLVYMGGNTLKNEPRDQPDNAGRVVNILASGAVWNGAWMDRAENIHEQDVYHFGTPSHPYTLEVLSRELVAVAGHVSVAETDIPAWPEGPAPDLPAEWAFLRPVARLDDEPAPARLPGPPR